jgi:hypothetical protein
MDTIYHRRNPKDKYSRNFLLLCLFALFSLLLILPHGLFAGSQAYNDLVSAAGNSGVSITAVPEAPTPVYIRSSAGGTDIADDKWPSLFGGVHKKIMKSALDSLNSKEFSIRRDSLVSGSSSESGHPSMSANGGNPEEIWYGTSKHSDGGVLRNWEQFNSSTAYRNIGMICHLTEDMAVPTHAANIPHGLFVHNDTFEGYSTDAAITVPGGAEGSLEPWAYYQIVQNETRRKLPTWVEPATGAPYWVEAENSLRMGEDNTKGPKGHYGGAGGEDIYANDKDISVSPEIHSQQLSQAAFATVEVIKAASRKLPPLVYNLSIKSKKLKVGETSTIIFGALDNNSHSLDCVISVYRDGALVGTMSRGVIALLDPRGDEAPYFSRHMETEWTGVVDFKVLPPGKYELEVTLTDEDGNVTPPDVNQDDMPENDTRITVTVK